MNWSIVAILVTVGLAQAALVVALVDRLFKAEIRILSEAIKALRADLAKRDKTDGERDEHIRDLHYRVTRLEEWRATL